MSEAQADYDSAWKEALEADLPAFLHLQVPALYDDIDWTCDHTALDAGLRQIELPGELACAGVIADRLVRLTRRTGDEALLHVEVTITPAGAFARRMSLYNDRAEEKYGLPVGSIAVLGDDQPEWRPTIHERGLWGTRKTFTFESVKLLDWAERQDELLTGSNPFGLLVVAHLQARQQHSETVRRDWRTRLWRRQRELGLDELARRKWERCLEWLLPLTPTARQEMMAALEPEERRTNVSLFDTLDEILTERGMKEGMKKGMKEGRKEGLKEGRQESIRLGMELLYGQVDEALLNRLAELDSPDAYQAVQAALRSRSPAAELWAVVPPASTSPPTP